MLNEIAKFAGLMLVTAVVIVGGLQNHWFSRGGDQFRSVFRPRAEAQALSATNAPVAPRPPLPAPIQHHWGVVELLPNARSQYETDVEINGVRIHALIDTGAFTVALRAEDAQALNLYPDQSAFTMQASTANGVTHIAPTRLREIRVDSIVANNVDAAISEPGALHITLLGMSFLKKLSSFQVADGRFVMKQ